MISKLLLVTIVALSAAVSQAFPEANKKAPVGGVMNYNLDAEPESLHPIMAGDRYSTWVQNYVYDTMCTKDENTYKDVPRIAERWEVSKDGLQFTFFLRKDAYFHNGENVTTDDVKFSLDAIREPKHQALNLIPYYEKITKVDVIDKYTIKFTASEKYFKNFDFICGMLILPKSVYGDISKSVKLQKEMIGSGPYKLEKYDKSQMITLKKFDKWYGDKDGSSKGYYNFNQINFKFTKDDVIIAERLKKGDVDFHEYRNAEAFLKLKGDKVGKTVFANKVANDMPKSYGFIGFNFKKEALKDKNVRLAFAHLVNRADMNKKFHNNLNYLATSPIFVKSPAAPDIKPIEFSPKKAQEILAKAGWKDADKNGVLEKEINGQKVELKFTFIYANKNAEKWWTIVKEDAKSAGVEIELKYLEWNSFIKNVEDSNFELMAMGWGGGSPEEDPKQIWHSSSIGKGGSNFISYSNPEVDKLIDEARAELDFPKRTKIFKKVYQMIAEDVPYVFMWNAKYEFYANSNKVKKPGDTFRFALGQASWWATEK